MIPKLIGYQIRLYKCLLHGRLLGLIESVVGTDNVLS